MRLALITLFLALGLVACDKLGTSTEPIKPTRNDRTFTMTIEVVPPARITEHCTKLGVKYDANGCAAFNLDTKHCTIFVAEPRHVDDVERFSIIGHETWHCGFGTWHQ